MYLSHPLDKIWALDIEGDDLFPAVTTVWCLCAVNVASGGQVKLRDYGDIRRWLAAQIEQDCRFIGHNGIGYDFRVLNSIVGCRVTIGLIIDTMLMSMVYSPSISDGHSLAAWGKRLGHPKTEWNDFSNYSPEMEEYCMNDAILCKKIYIALRSRMLKLGFTDTGLEIEHRAWQLLQKQKDNGFAFNIKEAHILYSKLREKENEIRDKIHEFWPPTLECVFTGKQAYRKDGKYTANYTRHQSQYVDVRLRPDGQQYDCYDYVYFSIGSPAQRVEKLLELGWKPLEFTKKTDKGGGGNPQPTVKGQLSPSLAAFVEESGKEEVRLIAQWIEYNARANMINTWMEAYNERTGCIHGSLWLANTLRYRHSNPNTANIPAVRIDKQEAPLRQELGVYTYEARDLWTVRSPDRVLVGVDAKGIQLRVLAHYLNNKEFTDAVLNGDPHSFNQEVGGFRTRAMAKTFIYAFLLGAGDEKVGQIIGGSTKDGRDIKRRFVNGFPGLSDLLDDLGGQVERTGRIRLCDGTPIIVSAPHTRLGYLLQGDESRIMKKAAILSDYEIRRRRLDVLKVGDIHDEWQNDCLKEHTHELTEEVFPESFRRSGEFFNYRIPIGCSSKVGLTWAETH